MDSKAVPVRLLPLSKELAVRPEGGRSSLRSGFIICAMTGCECLSCIIRVISLTKALESLTSTWASASGLSNTILFRPDASWLSPGRSTWSIACRIELVN